MRAVGIIVLIDVVVIGLLVRTYVSRWRLRRQRRVAAAAARQDWQIEAESPPTGQEVDAIEIVLSVPGESAPLLTRRLRDELGDAADAAVTAETDGDQSIRWYEGREQVVARLCDVLAVTKSAGYSVERHRGATIDLTSKRWGRAQLQLVEGTASGSSEPDVT